MGPGTLPPTPWPLTHSLAPISASGLLKGKEASLPPPREAPCSRVLRYPRHPHPLRCPGSVGVPTCGGGGGSQKRLRSLEPRMAPPECQTPILSSMILQPPPRSHCGDSPRASSASPAWSPLCSQAVNYFSDRTCPPYTWLPAPSSWGHASSLRATPPPSVPAGTPSLGSCHPENRLPVGTWQARPLLPPYPDQRRVGSEGAPPSPAPPRPPRGALSPDRDHWTQVAGPGRRAPRTPDHGGPGSEVALGRVTRGTPRSRPPHPPRKATCEAPGPRSLSGEAVGRRQGRSEPSRGCGGGQGGRQPTRPSRAEKHALHNSSKPEPPQRRQQRARRAPRRGGPSEAAAAR